MSAMDAMDVMDAMDAMDAMDLRSWELSDDNDSMDNNLAGVKNLWPSALPPSVDDDENPRVSFSSDSSASSCTSANSSVSSQPSQRFSSLGIDSRFGTWSPSEDDDWILLSLENSESAAAESAAAESAAAESAAADSDDANPEVDWGVYKDWSPVPTPYEAELLLQKQEEDMREVHARAAAKRAERKRIFVDMIRQKRAAKDTRRLIN